MRQALAVVGVQVHSGVEGKALEVSGLSLQPDRMGRNAPEEAHRVGLRCGEGVGRAGIGLRHIETRAKQPAHATHDAAEHLLYFGVRRSGQSEKAGRFPVADERPVWSHAVKVHVEVEGTADRPSEMESLSAYIAAPSRGMKLDPGMSHAKEKQSYELGRALYFHRAGAWDFSCASCHGEEGKRIRMQDLPVLYKPEHARPVVASWPAYRVSNSQFITLQWRMNDCYRQMRMPEPNFTSEATVALTLFHTATGKGEPYHGPGTKR